MRTHGLNCGGHGTFGPLSTPVFLPEKSSEIGAVLKWAVVGSLFGIGEAGVDNTTLLPGVFIIRSGKLRAVNHELGHKE